MLTGLVVKPMLKLVDSSGSRALPPRDTARSLVGSTVPSCVCSPEEVSKVVTIDCRFDWPGVGARKPVEAAPRSVKVSETL